MFIISACNNPQQNYFKMIKNQGFMPFIAPTTNILPGSLYSPISTEQDLITVGPYDECFSPQALRYDREIDLPSQTKKFKIKSNIDLSQMTASGNPLFRFNYNSSIVSELNIEIKGGRTVMLNARAFARFFHSDLDDSCKYDLVKDGMYYISESLKVEQMKIIFTNSAGGKIEINSNNIDEFIELKAGVEWEISNNYELIVNSPKFIGYKLGKIEKVNNRIIMLEANSIDNGTFVFNKKYSFRSDLSNDTLLMEDNLDFLSY
jgi:hypothetical protein